MANVRVSFLIESDDPSHSTGVTTETYDRITSFILDLIGGDEINFTPVEEGEDG